MSILFKISEIIGPRLRGIFDLQTREEYDQSVENFYQFSLNAVTEKVFPDHHWIKINDSCALQGRFFLASKQPTEKQTPISTAMCDLLLQSFTQEGFKLSSLKIREGYSVPVAEVSLMHNLGDITRVCKIKSDFEKNAFDYFVMHMLPEQRLNAGEITVPETAPSRLNEETAPYPEWVN